ncbi:Melanoma inhibitory activity protein 2 [Liparis tanakae]|uniref:Melanoma inhibitory activity protein 2 n=1 Tax=Liparis tanakae TaxID=230148 RepID=A0A4Z2GZG3_9TELE|nr:Melanoma inhibitory activity protein 2 [Liparis tanakae]
MAVSVAHRILWATGFVFVIVPHFSLGLLSDYKICGDSECESLMSRVQATRDHHGRDCRFLSFRRGETIFVYHKLAGKRGDLWAGTIDKQFGYFPKEAVREEQVYATAEKVVETQKSDFFCMDKFGYPIDSSHLDGDAEDDQKNQESETAHTTPYPDDTSAESPTTSEEPSAESPVSSLEAGGTSAEEDESKSASAAAAGTHEGAGETPAARMEQGFKNDKKEVDESAESGLKGTEEDKTGEHPTGSENEEEEVEEIKEERKQEKVEEMQEVEEIKEEGEQKEGKEIKDKGKQEEVEEIKEVWKQEDVKEMKEVKKQEEVEMIMEERKQEEVEKIKKEGKQVEVEVILEVGELEEVEEIMEDGKPDNVEKIKEEWKQQIDEFIEERQEEGEELKEMKEREELKEVEGVKEQGEEKQAESHFEEEMKNNLHSLRHAEKDTGGPERDGEDTRDTNSSEPVFSKPPTRTEESRTESPPTEDEEREEGKVRGEMKEKGLEENEERLRRNRDEEETLKCSNDLCPQASVDGSVKNRDGNDPADILSSIEEGAMETGKQNDPILADRKGANQLVPIEDVEKDEDGVQVEEEKRNEGKNNYLPHSGDSVDPRTTEHTEDDQLHSGEAHNAEVGDPEPMSNGVSAEKEAEQVPSDPETVTGERSDQEEGESSQEHEADVRRDEAMAGPVSSVNLAVRSEQSAPSDGHRAGPSGGAFGLFRSAFSFFGSPLEETGGSQETPPSLGSDTFTVRGSLPSERALDSTTDPGQVNLQDVHTSPQVAETRTSPPSPMGVRLHPADSPIQTKTPATHYKNLLAHMSAGEATVLTELFGRHKLQFLDYVLGSAGPTSGDPHADGSILLDIERLLGHHREALMAPRARLADAPREDKERTGALVALQKLETLLARVRETISSGEPDVSGRNQHESWPQRYS